MEANSYGSPGTTGGNRESLENLLTILEPEETPYTSMVKKGGDVSATYTEWLADTLRAPKRGGTREGADAGRGSNKATKRQRFGTYLNRSLEEYGVTDVEEEISKRGGVAATDDLYAEAKAKTLREMKRDMEFINCSNQEHQGSSSTANNEMQTRGCFKWLSPTVQATNPVPSDFRPASGQILSSVGSSNPLFTENQLNDVAKNLKRVYGAKRTYQLLSGDLVVQTVDGFTRVQPSSTNQRYQVRQDADEYEITMMVRVFESSFARFEIVPSQFLNGDTSGNDSPSAGLILNMELWQMMFLEKLFTKDLDPEQAGGPRGYAKQTWLNRCNNPKGNGMIYDSLN